MEKLYIDADIFVFPSIREATGTVIFEAMSFGLPIIALNINGASVIIDESCGILVNTNSEKQMISDFTTALVSLCNNPSLRHSMGEKAREKVVNNFTWEFRGEVMQSYYEKIINNLL